jgi:ATPase subunit of ABC transporter with duplicated ATPase domains
MGLETADAGDINKQRGIVFGYVPQQPEFAEDITVAEELKKAFPELQAIEARMAELDGRTDAKAHDEYDRLMEEFECKGGYQYESKLESVADQLGLTPKLSSKVKTLSGGERNLLGLTKAVAVEPDILILDEPGNHLDFKGLEKLETFLSNYTGAFIMVAHDRYLLDQTVGKIFDLDHGVLSSYTGNYSAYREQKLQTQIAAQAAYENNQKEVRRMEAMVKRLQIWARESGNTKIGNTYRNKKHILERMERKEKPPETKAIQADFQPRDRSGLIALDVKGYEKSFGDKTLFRGADLRLHSGDKVALIGPNGCGKSTLVKSIVAEAHWEHPVMRVGPSIRIGYYSQHHEDNLDFNHTIESELMNALEIGSREAFGLATRFNFTWEDMSKKIGPLSGGEKSRIQLAKLIGGKANFLILDEPTNHLDIPAKEQLEEALDAFDGSILFITHDRFFLRKIANRVVVVENKKIREFYGDFEESLVYAE